MKTKKILETLVLAACCTGSAHAAILPLQNALITGTYNGQAAGMLGNDLNFGPNSNTTHLAPTITDVEFLTSDYLFGFDFDASGNLAVYANDTIPVGSYKMRFDFGSSVPGSFSSFSLTDMGGNGGVPVLSLINAHTIEVDLSSVTWNGAFSSFSARIGTVPEPGSITLLLGGLAGLALVRRPRTSRS